MEKSSKNILFTIRSKLTVKENVWKICIHDSKRFSKPIIPFVRLLPINLLIQTWNIIGKLSNLTDVGATSSLLDVGEEKERHTDRERERERHRIACKNRIERHGHDSFSSGNVEWGRQIVTGA